MSRLSMALAPPSSPEPTACSSMFVELQNLWDEIGETDAERDTMILQLERECLDVYRRKVDQTRKHKADLHQQLAEAETEASNIISALGEREPYAQMKKTKGTLKEQVAAINPWLESLRHKRDQRFKEFMDVHMQISLVSAEIAGNINFESVSPQKVEERNMTLKRLEELKAQLQELQADKTNRVHKITSQSQLIHDLTKVMSMDFHKKMTEVHPTFKGVANEQPKNISNDTLARLNGTVNSLNQEKSQRLKKLKYLASTLVELWNLMDTTMDERERFNHVTSLMSASNDVFLRPGSLAVDVIKEAEEEVQRLNILKASKMEELVMKKQNELEEIYRSVHVDVDSDLTKKMLIDLIKSGRADLSELLSSMDSQIADAKEQALSRKDILEKVEKWKFSSQEENWLDDYERDQNRYSAGRGAHKNLKRAEKARMLVGKIPSLVLNLVAKVESWEKEKGMPFLFEKVRLTEMLEDYRISRQKKEEEKRRSREQKKLQEQLTAEQEVLYGSKPSPLRPVKKPLGQSSNANVVGGTPGRRVSTPFARSETSSAIKERKMKLTPIPVNYVSLPKDGSLSHNNSATTVSIRQPVCP